MATKIRGSKAAEPAFKKGGGGGIEKVDITSNKSSSKKISVTNATAAVLYYESILQDSVRATVTFSDTGGSVDGKTAMEGLPIVGQENVQVQIRDNNDNEIKVTLYVNSVTPLVEDTRKSIVQLELASKEFIMNEKVRINKRFNGKISDHIKKILEESIFLGTEKEIDIEETSNEQNYIGNNKKPFYIINWLCRGAVPKDGSLGNTAGYFFWETAKKFYFKSIDSLMDTQTNKPKKSYLYNETPDNDGTNIPEGYDDKALEYSVNNKVNIQDKLKMGAYSTRIIMFDPYTTKYEVVNPNAGNTPGGDSSSKGNEKNLKLAGKGLPILNKEFNKEEPGKEFSRTTFMVLDKGSLVSGSGAGQKQEQIEKSKEENYEPGVVLNQGIQRMNQLFALETSITIPGDFSLHAGDAIYVDAPELKDDKKDMDVNKQTGGNYIIADVCHYVSSKHTLTKLNLIRDSFGRKPKQRG
mgnify:CR=1 FL=1|tara:strand:- start:52 stop:1455 length:1404 start_codon:yes stop_codon:yes gene_type:complete